MGSVLSGSRTLIGAALALVLIVPVALPAVAQDPSAVPAPVLADLQVDGGALAAQFMDTLGLPEVDKVARLDHFLADEFQIVRADGSRLTKVEYLAKPADVHEYTIADVVATQHEDIVIVSYTLATTETIDGVQQTTTAPRLSVFHWDGADWQLAAHSNFGALSVTAEPSAAPAA